MAVPVFTKPYQSGDVFIREGLSREYDSASVLVDNTGGSANLVIPAGYPMVGAVPATAAQVAGTSTDSVSINDNIIVKGTKQPIGVFAKGTGIVVCTNMLQLTDVAAGAAFTLANMNLNLVRLGFTPLAEPTKQEIQTKAAPKDEDVQRREKLEQVKREEDELEAQRRAKAIPTKYEREEEEKELAQRQEKLKQAKLEQAKLDEEEAQRSAKPEPAKHAHTK